MKTRRSCVVFTKRSTKAILTRWMNWLRKIISTTVRRLSPFAPGREGLKQAFKLFWEATPGYHRIEDQIAEGDKVATRLTSFGKHEGDLPGAPRTGNDLKMTSITIHRIAKGRLVEKWAEKDVLGFLQQIGVMPTARHD